MKTNNYIFEVIKDNSKYACWIVGKDKQSAEFFCKLLIRYTDKYKFNGFIMCI